MFGPAWKHKIHRKLCSHTALIPCTCTATQFLDYSLNRSVTCSMSYITHCIMFCLWLFFLSCFHRNSGWIAFCTMATATPVSIGRELPSLCWWCWDSSVAMAASQRAGRWTVLMNIYDTSIKKCRFFCCHLACLFRKRSTVWHGYFLLKAVVRSVFLFLVNYSITPPPTPPPSCLKLHYLKKSWNLGNAHTLNSIHPSSQSVYTFEIYTNWLNCVY